MSVCVQMHGLAAVLAIKRSVGVTLEVNLRNPLHTPWKAQKDGIHPDLETQGRQCHGSRTGVSVAPEKGQTSSKN